MGDSIVEVKNEINFRNIFIFFVIGILGVINGFFDFLTYKLAIMRALIPDPVVYTTVVLNNTNMVTSVQNSMPVTGLIGIGAVVLVMIMVIGFVMGTCGAMGAMGD